MNCKKSILSAAIVASLSFAAQLHAQETTTAPAAEEATDLDRIVVTGIRGSIEKSLDVKREARSHVEVITAEDIGKMPDKNVADSLQRLPGVTISSAGATEVGFDENDRGSLHEAGLLGAGDPATAIGHYERSTGMAAVFAATTQTSDGEAS